MKIFGDSGTWNVFLVFSLDLEGDSLSLRAVWFLLSLRTSAVTLLGASVQIKESEICLLLWVPDVKIV